MVNLIRSVDPLTFHPNANYDIVVQFCSERNEEMIQVLALITNQWRLAEMEPEDWVVECSKKMLEVDPDYVVKKHTYFDRNSHLQ